MGYLKIRNLYQDQDILLFKECYALEKIHGTSAHLRWDGKDLHYFSGGENHEKFKSLFPHDELVKRFNEHYGLSTVIVYGEAYGGKQQGMSQTYGPSLKFIVFDVQFNDNWLVVPAAEKIAHQLGLEFVYYVKIPTDLELINTERDKHSAQAIRNGMGEGKIREGVVLRPLIEVTKNNGNRVIAKHKHEKFSEHSKPRTVETDPEKIKIQTKAIEIADDWVTPMRLEHVLDKLKANGIVVSNIEHTSTVISAMLDDIKSESLGEIEWSKPVTAEIGKKTAKLWKQQVTNL